MQAPRDCWHWEYVVTVTDFHLADAPSVVWVLRFLPLVSPGLHVFRSVTSLSVSVQDCMASSEKCDGGQPDAKAAASSTTVTSSLTTVITASVSSEVIPAASPKDIVDMSSVIFSEAMADLNVREESDSVSVGCPRLLHTVDTKRTGESSPPLLYDVTVSQSGHHAIVTDCWNRCVKAFDLTVTGCPCTSVFQLKEECPLCITKLSHPERAVITLHQRSELYVLNILEQQDTQEAEELQKSNNSQNMHDVADTQDIHDIQNTSQESRDQKRLSQVLTFHSVITTSSNYRGISTLSGQPQDDSREQLVLTLPKEIHVVSLSGDILQVIAPNLCGLPLLMDVIYVTTTPSQDLVVTDVGAKRVLCLTSSGSLRWSHPSLQLSEEEEEHQSKSGVYRRTQSLGDGEGECSVDNVKGLQWPLGVASDLGGRVLVCDLGLHSVVLLSSDGTSARLLLTQSQALQYPRGLSISNGCLCLTQDHCIKIFAMT